MSKNPFEIKTPEQNSADEIVSLFVDVFTDFFQVKEANHTFINGPRGSGKSMMFRYILPDCQKIVNKCEFNELDFFSIYIPIKKTNINIVDLERLEKHANTVLNEHLLVSYVLSISFEFIADTISEKLNDYDQEIQNFYESVFLCLLKLAGYQEIDVNLKKNGIDLFKQMAKILDKTYRECSNYCKRIAIQNEIAPYNGPLVDFIDFLLPLFRELKKLPFFPKDKAFYLLFDDAGYLNKEQTKILNTWVSYRTTKDVCLKISTQHDYLTFLTSTGKRIDSPHDYSEINIATKYTSSEKDYYKRIKMIVEKRLDVYLGLKINAEDFFPEDVVQEKTIKEIYAEIVKKKHDPNKKYQGPDAARRYCRSEFVKELKSKRSGMTYSYAGFGQLVAISSGVIRHFLAPAQEMYSLLLSREQNSEVKNIPDYIQNEVINSYSAKFLTDEFEKIFKDSYDDVVQLKKADKLNNLVDSLGQLFHAIFVSDRAERVVFSVALSDSPDSELQEVIDLGIKYGYFHKSTIGNKTGTGRNSLYILSRVLSPYYRLNPLGFFGYQFMPSDTLKIALTKPKDFINLYLKRLEKPESENELTLFD
ncbi:MAG: hypothetical protein JW870_10120 [Candidatus Delongbacteria bacterium]|nr:hypothetical protein [Candidatus Delongbacteria bacterium]